MAHRHLLSDGKTMSDLRTAFEGEMHTHGPNLMKAPNTPGHVHLESNTGQSSGPEIEATPIQSDKKV